MAKPSRTASPGRARVLWIGNLCLAAGFAFLAVISDDGLSRGLALFLVALSLAIAATWFRLDRRARGTPASQHDAAD